jgi:hypothetical protein
MTLMTILTKKKYYRIQAVIINTRMLKIWMMLINFSQLERREKKVGFSYFMPKNFNLLSGLFSLKVLLL